MADGRVRTVQLRRRRRIDALQDKAAGGAPNQHGWWNFSAVGGLGSCSRRVFS